MDFDDDSFSSSLPPFQPSPHVFNPQEMTESFEESQDTFFDSPGYPYGSFLNPDFQDSLNDKGTSQIQAAEPAPIAESAAHAFLTDSPSTSLGSSDSSSGGASTEERMTLANTIHIPADLAEHSESHDDTYNVPDTYHNGESSVDQWFDIDSAAGSPTYPDGQLAQRSYNLTHRPALRFGVGVFEHNTPMTKIDALHQLERKTEMQTVSGPQIENARPSHARLMFDADGTTPLSGAEVRPANIKSEIADRLELHISTLPRTQRVETQMHVALTLPALPSKIKSIRFQKHTLARQKLLKKDCKSSPSTLELYAHCVCDTAMRDPAKRSRAFDHANAMSFRDGSGSPPVEREDLEDYPREPLEGGFVSICGQCIQRETKRASRKKQEDEGHEEWLKDQPKRIIVFNRDELMEWKDWRTVDEGQNRHPFSDSAVQVRFPMRIQCYSRHHNDKDGYRVIFTIKDFENRLVAQSMSSATTITDDHKAHSQNRSPTETSAGLSEGYAAAVSPVASALISARGANLSRHSFSTPDLSRLPYTPQSQASTARTNWPSGRPPSLHGSRPASPTIPSGHHSKKRKSSGVSHTRIRSDLAMTPFHRNLPRSPPGTNPRAGGPLYLAGLPQPMAPSNYAAAFDHSASASAATSNPSTPGGLSSGGYHQRSQSVENFAGYQGPESVASSAWHSQVPSVESSPQPYNHGTVQPQALPTSLAASSPDQSHLSRPSLHKLTPTEGPAVGGIEVTCLGNGFTPDSRIFFGKVPAPRTSFWSSAALLCTLPPATNPGYVDVTVRNPGEHEAEIYSQDQVFFKYIDNSEENMMRHTIAILSQQFAGGSAEARDFTQSLLSSFGSQNGESAGGFMPSPSGRYPYQGTSLDHGKVFKDLEDAILGCLELIDLDEKPNMVDINRRDSIGQSMLHLAAYMNFYRVTAGLLARGADVDVRDNNGLTPMHLASLRGNAKIVRKLQSSGADSAIRSLDGRRPSDLTPACQISYRHGRAEAHNLFASRALKSHSSSRANSPDAASQIPHYDTSHRVTTAGIRSEVPVTAEVGGTNVPPCVKQSSIQASRPALLTVGNKEGSQLASPAAGSDNAFFATNPAISAWKDQLSAQVQQLQQSLQRALPLMPALPDYQAYPVMRRISSLVPQRATKADDALDCPRKFKEADYNWWDLFMGPNTSPPAYDEIYPHDLGPYDHTKPTASTARAPDCPHNKCNVEQAATPEEQYVMGKVNLDRGSLTSEQQQKIREAYARKVKRLGNDRKLFFIWIPLLLLILAAILFDRASDLVRLSETSCNFVNQHVF